MAVKTRYCPHPPHTHVYRRSKSSRLMCCRECYFKELREEIVRTLGEEMADRLDAIKKIDTKFWEVK